MLHPAKRKLGDQHNVVLREREFVVEIGFEILNALAIKAKDLGSVGFELGGLGFTDVDRGIWCP